METKGFIKEIYDGQIKVIAYRESACVGCNKCTPDKKILKEYTLSTNQNFDINEEVVLHIDNKYALKIIFLIYIFTLLFFFAGYAVSYFFTQNNDLRILFSFVGLGVGIIIIKLVDKFIVKTNEHELVTIKKIN